MKYILALLLGVSAVSAQTRVPVLLELFTSEGCSSCPPADRLLESFDQSQPFSNAELIVLSEHVDYWNHLGWSDPYSSAQFSDRQRQYARHLASDDVYTPELVVDGATGFVGSDKNEAHAAIEKAAKTEKVPVTLSATRSGKSANIHIETQAKGDVYLVLAADRARSQVSAGENSGRALTHVAVVYSLQKVAANRDLTVPLKSGATRVIAFVQDHNTGKVLGASQVRIGS